MTRRATVGNGTRLVLSAVVLLLAGQRTVHAQTLDPDPLLLPLYTPMIPPVQFGSAAWGDYDGDGDLDLFYTGSLTDFDSAEPLSQLFINDGDFLAEVPDPAGGSEPIQVMATRYVEGWIPGDSPVLNIWRGAVAWGDYDNDGDLDVLATGILEDGTRLTTVYENVRTAVIFIPALAVTGVSDGDVAWVDYDNDGDLDFMQSGTVDSGAHVTELYENRLGSGGGFVSVSTGIIGLTHTSLSWGDYDNDADFDLLISGVAEPQEFVTRIYRNDGGGIFMQTSTDLGNLVYSDVEWGDMDADGDLDILISGGRIGPFILQGETQIYENSGGSFTAGSVTVGGSFEGDVAYGRYGGSATWGDVNNDGYLDFMISGSKQPVDTRAAQVFFYTGNRSFAHPAEGLRHGAFGGGLLGTSFWGDYDNDNDLDLFILGRDVDGSHVATARQNHLPVFPSNRRPGAPGSVSQTAAGNSVDLTWTPGSDSATPVTGLTYNVRVGTTPGGVDVMSPMASPETGWRHLSSMGNVQHNTNWRLNGLAPGTYYWSVQSIDSSFKGSPFTIEASFIIN